MPKSCLLTLICFGAMLAGSAYGFEIENATLLNKDSKSYSYIIKTACERDITHDAKHELNRVVHDCGIYYGTIASRSQVAICHFGCELTLAKTGQTITVEPGETIVIRKGILKTR